VKPSTIGFWGGEGQPSRLKSGGTKKEGFRGKPASHQKAQEGVTKKNSPWAGGKLKALIGKEGRSRKFHHPPGKAPEGSFGGGLQRRKFL